jgi:outer membrane protein
MNLIKILKAVPVLLVINATLWAQQQPAAPAQPGKGKVAVINTAVLQDQIGEYKSKVESLNRQFEPRGKELQSLAERIGALENTIKTQAQTLTAARIAEMTEQVETMKRDYKRKQEDLETDGQRALNQTLTPIKEKLNKFLQEFAARRGIVILIDLANAFEANTILWFDRRLDVTQEFAAEYNKVNPVAAAAAPAAPPKP